MNEYEQELREYWGAPPFYNSKEAYAMARITNEQIYREVQGFKIVLLGVPDTEDMGLYGEFRDMKKSQKDMLAKIITRLDALNGTVKSDHAWVCALKWVVGLLFIGMLAIITGQIGVW